MDSHFKWVNYRHNMAQMCFVRLPFVEDVEGIPADRRLESIESRVNVNIWRLG